MSDSKRVLIIAGPNGAGKTTFATEFLPNGNCPTFINADLIAAGLSPFRPDGVALQAARVMLGRIHAHTGRGESFAFETTLSGRGYATLIPRWRRQGYQVTLFFLRLPTPEAAIARVRQRVMEGGHDVPEAIVRRRFDAGRRNWERIYKGLVDGWAEYDTWGDAPVLVAEQISRECVDPDTRRQVDMSRSALLASARAATDRAVRLAKHGGRAVVVSARGLERIRPVGAAGMAVTTPGATVPNRFWRHALMELLPHDPLQFDVFDLLDAVGRTHGISIDSADGRDRILDIVKKSALQNPPATWQHGRRAEAMFGYVAAAIGRCSLVKKEDSRPAFTGHQDMKIPDYRLVTDSGQQLLVEVKNCHRGRLDSRVEFKALYLSQLQAYAALVNAGLRLAIYWSRLKIWTLISPQDLHLDGSVWAITFRDALMQNAMAAVGDMHVGTTPPLVCRLLENPDRPPKIGVDGRVEFTVRRVEIESAGRPVTERREKNLAFQLMLFGEWPASDHPMIDDGRLLGVEFVAEPIECTPGQGFEIIGSLSRMASRRYDELTAPSGRIERLAPSTRDPSILAPAIPADYAGRQLPLWRFVQKPSTRIENGGGPDG